MKIDFENDFQKKIMIVSFSEPTELRAPDEVRTIRSEWTKALASWHSPYKAVVDCTNLTTSDCPEVATELTRLISFLKGFHLRSIVGFSRQENASHSLLPFDVMDEEEAKKKVGLNRSLTAPTKGGFRDSVRIHNDFRNHVVEVSFSYPSIMASKDEVNALRSKLTNNLMQWHSSWNLLIDCTELTTKPESFDEFEKMIKVFKSFFMKAVLGYSPKASQDSYPFKVYRSRHNAVGRLEAEGLIAGNKADCQSRKSE